MFPYGGKLEVERGVPEAETMQRSWPQIGHTTVAMIERPHGGGQAIWIDRARGTLAGGSDPRKDGMALGY